MIENIGLILFALMGIGVVCIFAGLPVLVMGDRFRDRYGGAGIVLFGGALFITSTIASTIYVCFV